MNRSMLRVAVCSYRRGLAGKSAMVGLSLLVAAIFWAGVAPAQAGLAASQNSLPVRIGEARVDNAQGITDSDCALFFPDGRFHLERRQLRRPNRTATLKVFESALDSTQLQQLQWLLDSDEEKNLPPYDDQQPSFVNVAWFLSVTVDTGEGKTVKMGHRFGYWAWDKENAGPDLSPDLKARWRRSEEALRPLLQWFHGFEALKLVPSEGRPMECSAEAAEGPK